MESKYTLPAWLVITLAVIAVVAVCGAAYYGYTRHRNALILKGARAGYNQALIDIANTAYRDGYVELDTGGSRIRLVVSPEDEEVTDGEGI